MEKWNDRQTAFGLPKGKSMKVKVKKIRAEKAEGETVQPAAAAAHQVPPPASPAASEKKKQAPQPKK